MCIETNFQNPAELPRSGMNGTLALPDLRRDLSEGECCEPPLASPANRPQPQRGCGRLNHYPSGCSQTAQIFDHGWHGFLLFFIHVIRGQIVSFQSGVRRKAQSLIGTWPIMVFN